MARELTKLSHPVLVEPSKLYCKYNNCICEFFSENYGKICIKKSQSIVSDYNEAPTWCPLKLDALFPRKLHKER